LSDTIVTDVYFNVNSCDNIGTIRQSSPSGYGKTFTRGDYSCSNNQVTLNTITLEPSSESNEFLIEYGCGVFARLGYKIIGLVFAAGGYYYGFACRIDEVASQLNISAWDGTTKNYFNTGSRQFRTTPGGSYDKTIDCNDNIYWQVGTISNTNPCN